MIMMKNILFISAFCVFAAGICQAKEPGTKAIIKCSAVNRAIALQKDTIPPADVMQVITTAIYSTNDFNIEKVAELYTPNATITDDEPPYSWNGPTAGVQWVNAVEKVCKDNDLTKLKGSIGAINVFLQTADNVYIIVPVTYTGNLTGRSHFTAEGAFIFVLRMINGRWLIKNQAWIPKKGM
jgi:hypothetical protein